MTVSRLILILYFMVFNTIIGDSVQKKDKLVLHCHSVVVLLVRFTKVKVITADVLNMWYVRIDNGYMRSRWHQNGCWTKDMK